MRVLLNNVTLSLDHGGVGHKRTGKFPESVPLVPAFPLGPALLEIDDTTAAGERGDIRRRVRRTR